MEKSLALIQQNGYTDFEDLKNHLSEEGEKEVFHSLMNNKDDEGMVKWLSVN